MKFTAIILLSACLTASANGYSQKVTLSEKDAQIEKVFKAIEQQTGYVFFFDYAWLNKAKKVTVQTKDATLNEALALCFKDQPLGYTIVDKTIVVKEKAIEIVEALPPPPIDIKGRVTNESSEPVVVSVIVKGTNNSTTTNNDGYFELKGVDENATLVISGVSIETQEVKVNGKTSLVISIKIKITEGEEVIIKNAGYYTVKDREATGSISKVDSKSLDKQPVSNVLLALQGRIPGIVISPRTGVSGGLNTIQIRGQNSLRNDGNYPLYVIDGVPIDSKPIQTFNSLLIGGIDPLNTINPFDIESIEILKDADATSIYGSRGANGVVLITTKKGKVGKTDFDIQVYKGSGHVAKKMELLNTNQYIKMRYEAFQNDGPAALADLNNPAFAIYFPDLKIWDTTRYTDWQKVLFGQTANVTDMQASISGGSSNTSFRLGGGYHKETTVFPGDFSYQKAAGHFNLFHNAANQKFKTVLSISYGLDNNNIFNASPVYTALTLSPNAPVYINGNLDWNGYDFNTPNPLAQFELRSYGKTSRLISSADISYEILQGLRLKTSIGYTDFNSIETINTPKSSMPPSSAAPTRSTFLNQTSKSWIIEPQLNYTIESPERRLDILVGTTWQSNSSKSQGIQGVGYLNDRLLGNINAASQIVKLSASEIEYRYNALFGRINYKWKEKFIINLTARRDGSSRFGPDKKFANFGAIGTAWIFSQEEFIKKSLPFLSFGKLRGSFGTTGSDQISDYGYLSTFSASSFIYQGSSILLTNALANADYAWEINKKLEFSLHLGFLKDRISFVADWYRNRSSNQLVGYPLPAITGFASVQANLDAIVQNTGWEFEVATKNIVLKNLKWLSSINFTVPQNKLVSYPNIAGSSYANTYEVGQPITILKFYHNTGVNPQTGNYQFLDVNQDGVLNSLDQKTIINIGRQFYGGINNTISYKSLELNFFIEFVKQNARGYLGTFLQTPGLATNQPAFIMNLDRWKQVGDVAKIQKFTNDNTAYNNARNSDLNVDDASFIRMKTISLSYGLPYKVISKAKIKEASIYVQGQNLFMIDDYIGLDPEIPGNSQLPQLKMVTAGIKLKF